MRGSVPGKINADELPERGCGLWEFGEECGVKREGVKVGTCGEGWERGEGVVSREIEVFQLLQLEKCTVCVCV